MEMPKRKQIRLPNYDYSSPGSYFVTICTKDRRCILSDITVGDGVLDVPRVCLTSKGKIVEETLREITAHYTWLAIGKYVIMPNHIHLLLQIGEDGTSRTSSPTNDAGQNGTSRTSSPANSRLAALISTLKRFTNKLCGVQLWQRSYHEHVIRNEHDYREIWEYIESNPVRWTEDRYYSE